DEVTRQLHKTGVWLRFFVVMSWWCLLMKLNLFWLDNGVLSFARLIMVCESIVISKMLQQEIK
ncbi:hypothetical protein OM200_05920, partial [Escherichia albertii]|nr:hypothetical protein [Escherichia albertii]